MHPLVVMALTCMCSWGVHWDNLSLYEPSLHELEVKGVLTVLPCEEEYLMKGLIYFRLHAQGLYVSFDGTP
jgi:hypothetical protein